MGLIYLYLTCFGLSNRKAGVQLGQWFNSPSSEAGAPEDGLIESLKHVRQK
jgi:hypothetical protein